MSIVLAVGRISILLLLANSRGPLPLYTCERASALEIVSEPRLSFLNRLLHSVELKLENEDTQMKPLCYPLLKLTSKLVERGHLGSCKLTNLFQAEQV